MKGGETEGMASKAAPDEHLPTPMVDNDQLWLSGRPYYREWSVKPCTPTLLTPSTDPNPNPNPNPNPSVPGTLVYEHGSMLSGVDLLVSFNACAQLVWQYRLGSGSGLGLFASKKYIQP